MRADNVTANLGRICRSLATVVAATLAAAGFEVASIGLRLSGMGENS